MRKLILLFLLLPSICFADSELSVGGKTAAAHIIQVTGDSLRPRPYLDFEGSGVSGQDLNGKTVITITGGSGGGGITALTGGVTASGTGSVVATVATNANLTGPITSIGNATSITSQTGTGTKFVVDTSPTIVTPTVTTSLTTSTANIITDTTTGTKIGTATNQKWGFFNATPIVQPSGNVCTALQNLGLVTSCTVTATTNANLTGAVTSVGNATSLGSFSSANLASALTDETGSGSAMFSNNPKIVNSILDTNGNVLLGITATGSSVNSLNLANAATTTSPTLTATGSDTNIGINLINKGTGGVTVTSTNTTQSSLATGLILGNPGVSPGHFTSTGTAPTVATNDCGSTSQGTVSAGSTDVKGKFVVGTLAVTSCSITFNTAFSTAPTCITQDDTNILATKVTTTTTKLTTIGSVSLSGDTVSYHCFE